VEKVLAEKMLRLVNEDYDAVVKEMKEIDKLYISKQKQARQLRKAKEELEAELV
jgi:hypothetical protein